MKKCIKKAEGITLVALVVTIVIMLILAGVSLNVILGNLGILGKTQNARTLTKQSQIEEEITLWKADNILEDTIQNESIQKLLDNLEQKGLIDSSEKNEAAEKGYITVGDKNISFYDGIQNVSYIASNSYEDIKFEKVITEGNIIAQKPEYTNYKIEGISNTKDGTYVTTGSVEGKSGILEVIGDIQDATFRYTLTNFMKGDEKFYCKINIDNEMYFQELNVIQGDVMLYEEDFVGIKYEGDNWSDDINENYTNGKAKLADSTNGAQHVSWEYNGALCELLFRDNTETGYLMIHLYKDGEIMGTAYIDTKNGNGEDRFKQNLLTKYSNYMIGEANRKVDIALAKKIGGFGKYLYIDAIKIYRK